MSRDLPPAEGEKFRKIYGIEARCEKCGAAEHTVRIWEGYNSPAKRPGGDIGPGTIVAAVLMCQACGHGTTIDRSRLGGKAA